MDKHSNKNLACSELIGLSGVDSTSTGYRLSSCACIVNMQGRRATGYVVESWDGTSRHSLSTVIECNSTPNDATEIPTPDVAKLHLHLNSIADKMSPLFPSGKVQLLIGRYLIDEHHVQ